MFIGTTESLRKIMSTARKIAFRSNDDIQPEHVLLALINEENGVSITVLKKLGIKLENIQSRLIRLIQKKQNSVRLENIVLSVETKKVIEFSTQESRRMGCFYVGTEHLLLGLIKVRKSIAYRTLKEFNVNLIKVRLEVLKIDKEFKKFDAGVLRDIPEIKDTTDQNLIKTKKIEFENLRKRFKRSKLSS